MPNDPITAHPLSWPHGWVRTPDNERQRARFSSQGSRWSSRYRRELSVALAIERVLDELRALGVPRGEAIISTNMELRNNGLPRSSQRPPDDPGVAVYWSHGDGREPRCMAVDQYDRVADNLAAIAATLSAMRAIERHGGAEILNRAFTGFAALPAPAGGGFSWWEELGVQPTASADEIRAAYRALARKHHPDAPGGSGEKFLVLQRAYELAMTGKQQ